MMVTLKRRVTLDDLVLVLVQMVATRFWFYRWS